MNNTNQELLSLMREIRYRVRALNHTVREDLKNFLDEKDKFSFRWLPSSHSKSEISIATTCTAIMTLSMNNNNLKEFYNNDSQKIDLVINALVDDDWDSSDLPSDNTFTSVLVLRTISKLLESQNISQEDVDKLIKQRGKKFKGLTIAEICTKIGEEDVKEFGIQDSPPHPALGYWFVDAASTLNVELEAKGTWSKIADWSTREFLRQISYIYSGDYTMMDPIAMAMAACILAKIRKQSLKNEDIQKNTLDKIPSYPELKHGILKFFSMQRESGIWDKYFPLFYYKEKGANYCWCFEVLEAIFHEFPDIIDDHLVLQTIDRTLNWITDHRLQFKKGAKNYTGWNSGSQLKTLKEGMPELWATGVIHMFLASLKPSLSKSIQKHILNKYNSIPFDTASGSTNKWMRLLDSNVIIRKDERSFKEIIDDNFIKPINKTSTNPKELALGKRSALLFGPPGTAKTSTVKAISEAINWPLLELSPSNFLSLGQDNIYVRADEIFNDLYELSHVVILFDEIDALVQNRDPGSNQRLSLTEQFLTTSMLPKLAKLYDTGKVLFFLATNHKKNFDDAIIRPGRFDMWLFVGPSSYLIKINNLDAFIKISDADSKESSTRINELLHENDNAKEIIEKSTYAEFRSFLSEITSNKSLKEALSQMTPNKFSKKIEEFGNYISIKEGTPLGDEFKIDKVASRIF